MHRSRLRLLALALCAAVSCAAAEDLFFAKAEAEYRGLLAGLSRRGKLDDDEPLRDRVVRIAPALIEAARATRSQASAWSWEVHVTTDPRIGATCIAGGKILVGSELVRRLDLSDAEIAMLLGHEMAHALLDHRRVAPRSDALDADAHEAAREAAIAMAQEDEADRAGMALAHRAGWRPGDLAGFFDKLAAGEPAGTFSSTHATAAARANAARAMALDLENGAP